MPATFQLHETREQIVREHMESENRHEYEATMETFHHPRYELIGGHRLGAGEGGGTVVWHGDPE